MALTAVERQQRYRAAHPERVKEARQLYDATNREGVNARSLQWYHANKETVLEQRAKNRAENPEKVGALLLHRRVRYRENPATFMLHGAKYRAKRYGLAFDLELLDVVIPKVCPVLGIPLRLGVGKPQDNSPTIDRLDSSKGYVKGNVAVISYRANRLKNDGTADEHERIAKWVRDRENVNGHG